MATEVDLAQIGISRRRLYWAVKRVMDVALALAALTLGLPLLIALAVLIRLDSPGPALFIQERIGKGGRPFRMFKFRTLLHNIDDEEHRKFMRAFVRGEAELNPSGKQVYKPFDNSQVTRIGRILRKTSLDELPQLINVLKGEMSIIGPRPNVPWEVEEYKAWHRERLAVLPGITGLAQISGRSGISFDTITRYDIEYVRHQGLGMDMRIMYRSLRVVLDGRGAH